MDFSFSEEQQAAADAAEGLMAGLADPGRVATVEAGEDRVDRPLWEALAEADLLGLPVPVDLGGAGLGLTEVCLLLEAQGRHVAPVPVWATLVLGVPPIARFGGEAMRRRWLPEVAAGRCFLTAGLASATLGPPAVRATPRGDGWTLQGTEPAVPQAHLAARVVLPAQTDDGRVVVGLVDPRAGGARLEWAETTNREIHPHLHLRSYELGAEEVLVGPSANPGVTGTGTGAGPEGTGTGAGPEVTGTGDRAEEGPLGWLLQVAATGLCALQLGVAEAAVARTADYLNQRSQFGRPLATFQATKLRAADAAIDVEAMRVTLWQAAWRLDTGRPAAAAVAVAKWQAAERGQAVVHAAQHLHGGIGADVSYPIHRYFLWGKQIELLLGGPSIQLVRLGRLIAAGAGRPVERNRHGVAAPVGGAAT